MGTKETIIGAQKKIIDDLAQCEDVIANLYKLYSTVMPEFGPFWKDLAAIEKIHANMLRSMHRQLDQGYVFRDIGRFINSATVASFLLRVRTAMDEAEDVSPRDAIQTALSIENSILDAHFYDIVQSDAPEFQVISKRLASDTQDHVDLVRKKMLEIQQGGS